MFWDVDVKQKRDMAWVERPGATSGRQGQGSRGIDSPGGWDAN